MDISQLYKDLQAMGRKMIQNEQGLWVLVKTNPNAPPILPETEQLLRLHWQQLKQYSLTQQGSSLSSEQLKYYTVRRTEPSIKSTFYQSRSTTLRQIVPKEKEEPEQEMMPTHLQPSRTTPAVQATLDFGTAPVREATYETDGAEKVKKSSSKKRTLLVRDDEPQYAGMDIDKEITPEMLTKIIRLRDSHRLVGPDHWFVRDWSVSLKKDASSMINRPSVAIKLREILINFGDCPFLRYIDEMYDTLSKSHPDRYRNWIREDCFAALKSNFKELDMVAGTVNLYPAPKNQETVTADDVAIETKWAWMEAPDGGIVDASWRIWPFGIFNYRKEVSML